MLWKKFNLALKLNKEDANEVVENLLKEYISRSFAAASQSYIEPQNSRITNSVGYS